MGLCSSPTTGCPFVPQGCEERGTRSHVAMRVHESSPSLSLPHPPHSMGRGLYVKEGTPPGCATMSLTPFHHPCPGPQHSPSPGHHAQEGCCVPSTSPGPSWLSAWGSLRGDRDIELSWRGDCHWLATGIQGQELGSSATSGCPLQSLGCIPEFLLGIQPSPVPEGCPF